VTFRAAQLRSTLARSARRLAALEGAIRRDRRGRCRPEGRPVCRRREPGVSARDSGHVPGVPRLRRRRIGGSQRTWRGRRPAGLLCRPRCPLRRCSRPTPVAARAPAIRSRGRVESRWRGATADLDPRVGAVAVLRDLRPTLVLERLRSSLSPRSRTLGRRSRAHRRLRAEPAPPRPRRDGPTQLPERLGAAVGRVAGLWTRSWTS
jgi:hypothetical protein